MRYGPGNTGDGNGKNEQCNDLPAQRHFDKEEFPFHQVARLQAGQGFKPGIGTNPDSSQRNGRKLKLLCN
jgi:hypothetical protein